MVADWTLSKLNVFLHELNTVTNELAEEVKAIKDKMPGRGILPAESPIIIARLEAVEDKLRKIASNKDYPLPLT